MVCMPLCSIYCIIIPVCQTGLLVTVTINYLRLVGFIQGFFTLPVGQSGLIFCNIQNIFYVGQRENESHFQYKIKIF